MPNAVRIDDLIVFYDAMDERADANGEYHGHTFKLYAEVLPERPQSYYGAVRRYLIAMGCVEQMRRGARHSQSVWKLHMRPTADMLSAMDPEAVLSPSQDEMQVRQRIHAQRIKDVVEQVGGIDVKAMTLNFEHRIAALEEAVAELQGAAGDDGTNPAEIAEQTTQETTTHGA